MFLTPDNPEGGGETCLLLHFPDTVEFKALVNGALADLIFENRWEEYGTLSVRDTAAIFKKMLRESEYRCMIGSIIPFAGETLPTWALPCNGTTYGKDDYPKLWDVIDPAFKSGDNFTTPDLVNRMVVGAKDDEGLYDVGATGGETSHVLTESEMPAHTHTNTPHNHTDLGHSHIYSPPGITAPVVGPGEVPVQAVNLLPGVTGTGFANITSSGVVIDSTGGDEQHNNMPPYLALKWVIIAK